MFTHRPTRQTQPYANPLTRPATPALAAMLRGAPTHQPNPADQKRRMQQLVAMILGHGQPGI